MESIIESFRNLSEQPVARQLMLLVGIAASITMAMGIVMWAQTEPYSILFNEMDSEEVSEVIDVLEREGVPYKLDEFSGLLSVPASRKHELRLRLAKDGLPTGGDKGFSVLYEDQQFGTSSFLENARFNRALEEELQQSIATLDSVRSARVHLAIPKSSSFIRSRKEVNASVIVNLKAGRALDEDQIAGIVYLVSASVPELEPGSVTVVDQKGRLLSSQQSSTDLMMSSEQYRFAEHIESKYVNAITAILAPLVGPDNVRANVAAELNFVAVEETSQQYNPDTVAMRSEMTVTEKNDAITAGGPVEILSEDPGTNAAQLDNADLTTTVRATRNYEVDHRVSHMKETPGSIKRLAVAVVVNYRSTVNAEGVIERTSLTEQELNDIRTLVRETVGFSEERGDSVIVTNSPFLEAPAMEEIPEMPIWKQAWVHAYSKLALGFVALLVLILAVVRPLFRTMTATPPAVEGELIGQADRFDAAGGSEQVRLNPAAAQALRYDNQLTEVKELIKEDPERVASVLKEWVTVDA